MRALYDSSADAEGELCLEEGQFIIVFDYSNDDWWHGTVKGVIGYFPASYVEQVEMREAPPEIQQQAINMDKAEAGQR